MRKLMILAALVVAGSWLLPVPAWAGPRSVDGTITLTKAQTTANQAVALASEAWEIDRVVFYNAGATTSAVTVATSDLGYVETIGATALAATGGACIWPLKMVSPATGVTNWVPYTVRDLRITAIKYSTAVDCVIHYRIYGKE